MKKLFVLPLSVLFLFFLFLDASWAGHPANESKMLKSLGEYVPGEVLVKFKPQARLSALSEYQDRHTLSSIQAFSTIGVEHLKLPEGLDVVSAVKMMQSDPNVEYVEPNYIYKITANPNDPYFGLLWGLNNTGQNVNGTVGKAGADIDAVQAWDKTTGTPNVIVAVIDSGVLTSHPDLAANIWVNPGEIPGNGIDDDLNGFIDDVNGWDFVFNDSTPDDENGHGTHVAGTIAAVGNNKIGVTGVSWNAKIMVLRAFDKDGFGTVAAEINSIMYASSKGAHVINCSWGGPGFSQSLKDAIDASPAVVVCASGNGGNDSIGDNNDSIPHYPSGYSSANIIAVAATDQGDELAYFSNYGPTTVDVAAPGVNILSTWNDGDYQYLQGTSMSTPHVSGLAALLWGYSGSSASQNRLLAAGDIISRIRSTVDPLPSLSGLIASGGRINADKALGGSGEDDDEGSGCFIATAAYGSFTAPHVKILRNFRDRYLKSNDCGRAFVRFYYRNSPEWAKTIQGNASLRWVMRTALLPIVGFSWLALQIGIFPLLASLFILVFLACIPRFRKKEVRPPLSS